VIQVNGMAHVLLTVSSFDAAPAFYDQLLPFLGLSRVFRGDKFAYWVGGRSAVGIQRCDDAYRSETFVQYRVGLHHLCFRTPSVDDDLASLKAKRVPLLDETARDGQSDRTIVTLEQLVEDLRPYFDKGATDDKITPLVTDAVSADFLKKLTGSEPVSFVAFHAKVFFFPSNSASFTLCSVWSRSMTVAATPVSSVASNA